MKKLLVLGIIMFSLGCNHKSNPKQKKHAKQHHNVNQSKVNLKQRTETSDSLVINKPPKKPRLVIAQNQKLNEVKDKPLEQSIIHQSYKNPNMNSWEEVFGKDEKWQDLYESSVSHYLNGLSNNLQQNPSLRMEKSAIVFVYGKKMYETFLLTPEFAEYSKTKFEQSDELSRFIENHSNQITQD